jgi:nicotinamide mononucleotide transporter
MLGMSWTEIAGFTTGALTVWLYVRQNMWAWPVGIANNAFWLVLFWQTRLFLDAGLQVVYIGLALWGWYWWLRGGPADGPLRVTRTGRRERVILTVVAVLAVTVLWRAMVAQADARPLWDSVTTVVSLIAQYMLTRKLLGTWWLWMSVDVIYTGVYAAEHLYLTAALQPLFFALCIAGMRSWKASLVEDRGDEGARSVGALPPQKSVPDAPVPAVSVSDVPVAGAQALGGVKPEEVAR